MKKEQIAVGLSGGVDSAVSAKILLDQGYSVVGVHLKLCEGQSTKEAHQVANQLGIELREVDLCRQFKAEIIDQFVGEYERGLTPNPCVLCNQLIKFGRMLTLIKEEGLVKLATGHYARVVEDELGFHLLSGVDEAKDQAYFLSRLTQKQLGQVVFPLGELTKTRVRQLAKDWGLKAASQPDSQDVCFLRTGNYRDLVNAGRPGPMVTVEGKEVGQHQGLGNYTLGQRKGLMFSAESRSQFGGRPPVFYVVDKDLDQNTLVVGSRSQAEKSQFRVKNVLMVNPRLSGWEKGVKVKIRSTGQRRPVKKITKKGADWTVELTRPELGIAPGQEAVFYRQHPAGWEVVGSGQITS